LNVRPQVPHGPPAAIGAVKIPGDALVEKSLVAVANLRKLIERRRPNAVQSRVVAF
jgi:hypothetical protein